MAAILSILFSICLLSYFINSQGQFISQKGILKITLASYMSAIVIAIWPSLQCKTSLCNGGETTCWKSDKTSFEMSEGFNINLTTLAYEFSYDLTSQIITLTVLIVSLLVQAFSFSYMKNDPFFNKFIATLAFFTLSMLTLVLGNNLIIIFIGWELVGFASFLLINFWFTRIQASKASMKAVIMNKFGDIGLIWLISLCWKTFGSTNLFVLESCYNFLPQYTLKILTFEFEIKNLLGTSLLIAIAGKSAQLGLHTWLPDAMEGPTPVSALLHAATMVTAGIFLAIKLNFILHGTPQIILLAGFLSTCTAISGALMAVVQNDAKKIVAYSTCSQLGYMLAVCSLGNPIAALYHLVNHAFFKAALFICCGIIIHKMQEQDIRKLGGGRNLEPISFTNISIASLSLLGLPFLSGFYSKELILENAALTSAKIGSFILHGLWCSAFLSVIYSLKLIQKVFLEKPKFKRNTDVIKQDSLYDYNILTFLSTLGVISGIFLGGNFKNREILGEQLSLNDKIACNQETHTEFATIILKMLPEFILLLTISIIWIANNIEFPEEIEDFHPFDTNPAILFEERYVRLGQFINKISAKKILQEVPKAGNLKLGFDIVYNKIVLAEIVKVCNFIYEVVDRGLLEFLGPSYIVRNTTRLIQWVIFLPQYSYEKNQDLFLTWLSFAISFAILLI